MPRWGRVGKQKIEDTGPLTKKRMETCDDEFVAAAKDFIKRQNEAGKPFFVWLNTTHMHLFTHTKPESLGQAGRWQSPYHDTMVDHDRNVGEMLDLLDELGIADNTFVMYSTDNGPHMNTWPDGGMTPFRSEKNTNWEGAFRVPLLVRWPGKIEAGSVANGIVQHHDWLPTFLAMAGAPDVVDKLKNGYKANGRTYKNHIDGYNLLPYLTGETEESPRNFFFYFSDDGDVLGMRFDNWKIVFMEQRVQGTMQVWAEPFTRAADAEDLQSAHRSLRARRHHVEHVLRLVHPPRLLHLRRRSRPRRSSWRRSRSFHESRSRGASPLMTRWRRCRKPPQAIDDAAGVGICRFHRAGNAARPHRQPARTGLYRPCGDGAAGDSDRPAAGQRYSHSPHRGSGGALRGPHQAGRSGSRTAPTSGQHGDGRDFHRPRQSKPRGPACRTAADGDPELPLSILIRGGLFGVSANEGTMAWNEKGGQALTTKQKNAARKFLAAVGLSAALTLLSTPGVRADQGGVSFWLPGAFGSLAAAPMVPALATIYLHSSVDAGGGVSASRTIGFPNRTVNFNVNLRATLDADVDIGILSPTYVFATPVLGGQFAITVLGIYGRQEATIDAKLNGNLGPIGFAAERSITQSMWGFGDVFVQPTLRWNQGVHNYMVYAMTSLPVGAYDSTRLVNLGLGHTAIDAGAGYTYFNPQTGNEFSVVTGLTYNFENPDLDYQNGIDWHLGWGASHSFQAVSCRRGGLCLSADHRRQRTRRDAWRFQVARLRHRAADRLSFPGRRHAGLR